jgi:hypothetical protein
MPPVNADDLIGRLKKGSQSMRFFCLGKSLICAIVAARN